MPNLTQRTTKRSPVRLWKLDEKSLFFGRGEGVHVKVEDQKMSRKHFVIVKKHGAYVIQDLKSKNGTFVNGHRVTLAVLKPWDKIRAGRTTFVFEEGLSTIIRIMEKKQRRLSSFVRKLAEQDKPNA